MSENNSRATPNGQTTEGDIDVSVDVTVDVIYAEDPARARRLARLLFDLATVDDGEFEPPLCSRP